MKSELNRLKAEESSLFNSILSNDYENSVLTSFKGEFTKYEDKSGGKLRPDWMNNSDDEEEDHYFVKYLNRGDTSAIRRRPLQLPGFHDYQHHSISPLQIYSKDIRTRQLECSMLGIKLSKEHHDWVVDCLSRNPLQRSKHAVEQVCVSKSKCSKKTP